MEIVIFPDNVLSESYYFMLKNNNMLCCSVGTRETDDINNFLKETKHYYEKELTNQEAQNLINMAKLLQESGYENQHEGKVFYDSWEVALQFNNKIYKANYFYLKNESVVFRNLIDEVIKLSPIKVNIHDWV